MHRVNVFNLENYWFFDCENRTAFAFGLFGTWKEAFKAGYQHTFGEESRYCGTCEDYVQTCDDYCLECGEDT